MSEDEALEAAYLAGFNASGEGYNGEYPFEHKRKNCTDDPIWCKDRDNELAAIKQARSAPVQEPVAWVPYLSDRADGVQGHYAIARWNPRGYREVWNLRRHAWGAFSDDVMLLEEADYLLQQITIPTRKPTPHAAPVQAIGYEEQTAIREGHRNASEDAYFAARPAHNNDISRVIFRHGFDRGYDTTPPAQEPKRQWVGLTAGERDSLFTKHYQWDDYGKAIEAKLKEKNT